MRKVGLPKVDLDSSGVLPKTGYHEAHWCLDLHRIGLAGRAATRATALVEQRLCRSGIPELLPFDGVRRSAPTRAGVRVVGWRSVYARVVDPGIGAVVERG